MMMSPETYYDNYLRGKNTRQIMREISKLKRDIKKFRMETELSEPFVITDPSEDVMLYYTRLYLEKAKKALVEVGGTYMPDDWEIKAEEFDNKLPYICKMEFSIGGYFYGYDVVTYTFNGNEIYRSVNHSYNDDRNGAVSEKIIDMDTANFLCEFAELHVGEWKSRYYDNDICDGTQWDLKIYYSDAYESVKFFGSNDYPYNFDKLLELFGCNRKYSYLQGEN